MSLVITDYRQSHQTQPLFNCHLAEMNTAVVRSSSTSFWKKFLCAQYKFGVILTDCSFNFQFKRKRVLWFNGEIFWEANFRLRMLMLQTLLKDHFARLWRGFSRKVTRFAMFLIVIGSRILIAVFKFSTHPPPLDHFMVSTSSVAEIISCAYRGIHVGDVVASWLVCSNPERAVRVRALAGDIVLYSWVRHSQCLFPPRCTNGYRRT